MKIQQEIKEHELWTRWWKKTRESERNYGQEGETEEWDSNIYIAGGRSNTRAGDQGQYQRREGIKAANEEEEYEDSLHLLVKRSLW